MSKKAIWDREFAPSYTPREMLEEGVFEGKYINNIKGLPSDWYSLPKVLGPDDEPDPSINKFGVKSRQPLSAWEKNGWIKTDANGWFHWYCMYWLGRRLGKEDDWQIGRWKSFIARHQAQIVHAGKLKDESTRKAQRQGLLQWGWDSTKEFTEENRKKNLDRLGKMSEVVLEGFVVPRYVNWR